jgi:hypothetical protein
MDGDEIEIVLLAGVQGPRPGRGLLDHSVTVRGREYEVKHVRQCDTCTSPHRSQIERTVMRGVTYADAARRFPEGDSRPSSRSVRQHFRRGHSPWLAACRDAVRDYFELQAAASILAPLLKVLKERDRDQGIRAERPS